MATRSLVTLTFGRAWKISTAWSSWRATCRRAGVRPWSLVALRALAHSLRWALGPPLLVDVTVGSSSK